MSTEFSPERAAAALFGARRQPAADRKPMVRLAPGACPTTMDEAVAAQIAVAQLHGTQAPAGFKIGATGARMQAYLGLSGPAAGFMYGDNLHATGSTISFDRFLRPGVECEIAVHLAHDLPPGPCTPDQAAAAVDLVMSAIEIVENRYADIKEFGTPALIADQVFHAAAIFGTPYADWRALSLADITGRITINGTVVGEGLGNELLGHPMQALAWLASSAEAAGFGGLRAGQVVMLGSVVPPVWLDGPGVIEVEFAPMEKTVLTLV